MLDPSLGGDWTEDTKKARLLVNKLAKVHTTHIKVGKVRTLHVAQQHDTQHFSSKVLKSESKLGLEEVFR